MIVLTDRYFIPANIYCNRDIFCSHRLNFYLKVEKFMNKYCIDYERIVNKGAFFSESAYKIIQF